MDTNNSNKRQDYANTKPPVSSAFGETSRGTQSDSPDVESAGDVPNRSVGWSKKAFDRFEGSRWEKNKPQDMDNDCAVLQNTGKPVYTQKK